MSTQGANHERHIQPSRRISREQPRNGDPVWKTIVEIANRELAATIVMGSRGLTGVWAILLGSVSSAVVRRADRPTLIIRHSRVEA